MDQKKLVKDFVQMIIEGETDFYPQLPWSENDYLRWARTYMGSDGRLVNRVQTRIKKLGLLKEE